MTGFVDTITDCYPGQQMECVNCGLKQFVNWGLVEPDHLSNASDVQECPHHICKHVYSGQAKKNKIEDVKAAYEYCAPSPEVKAVHSWWVEQDRLKKLES